MVGSYMHKELLLELVNFAGHHAIKEAPHAGIHDADLLLGRHGHILLLFKELGELPPPV